jgi:predicted AlkP superfamily phosphohydrolase/phosphomutase
MASSDGKQPIRPRVLIIGLDGAPPALIERLAAAGAMPHCARLLREGAFGVLRSTPNYNSFSAWCSFMTGVNPGKHGIFNFLNRVPGTYDLRRVHSSLRRAPSIFQLLSDAGRNVVALNVPSSYPAEAVRGLTVADWMTPSVRSKGFTYPESLAAEMLGAVGGDYPLHTEVRGPALAGRYDQAFRNLVDSFGARLAAAEFCLGKVDWSAAAIVFTETDAANHYFSHFDPGHPQHDPQALDRYGDMLRAAYAEADKAVGRLLAHADENTTVIVISDHGSCPESRGKAFTRGILEAMGALTPRRAGSPLSAARGLVSSIGKSAFELSNRMLPRGVKMRLDERFRGLSHRMMAGSYIADVDWERTKAYCYYWDTDPYVNLAGREPHGAVAPEEYDAVRDWIAEELLAARDAATGRPAVKQVMRREEVYHGPCIECSPDLIVWWDDTGPIERIRLGATGAIACGLRREPDAGRREVAPSTKLWDVVTGGHHPDGTVILWGRGIKAGRRIDAASIMDIAPTALHLLAQPVPAHMDGAVLTQALVDDLAAAAGHARATATVAVSDQPAPEASTPDEGYSDEERELVEQRLRNLGYL